MMNDVVTRKQIVDLYLQGNSPYQIAKIVGRAVRNIYTKLHQEGVFEDRRSGKRFSSLDKRKKYGLDTEFFKHIDSEPKAYFLGLLAADGYVDEVDNRVVLSLQASDVALLQSFRRCVKSTHKMWFYKDAKFEGQGSYKIAFNSKDMVSDLVDKGLRQAKSSTMTADCYQSVPESLRHHFLRGYFDGDGYVALANSCPSNSFYSKVQVVGTLEFLRGTYGEYFSGMRYQIKPSASDKVVLWTLGHKSDVVRFLDTLYNNAEVYLKRKRDVLYTFVNECAHVKPRELTGNPNGNAEGNQQPSNSKESAGSETIETT